MKTLIFLAVLFPSLLWADKVKLKDGTEIEGKLGAFVPARMEIVTPTGILKIDAEKLADEELLKIPPNGPGDYRVSKDEVIARLQAALNEMKAANAGLQDALKQSQKLLEEVVKRKASATAANEAAANLAALKPFEIGDAKTKIVESLGDYLRIGWKVTLINRASEKWGPVTVTISARDKDGVELLTFTKYSVTVAPGETLDVTGNDMVKASTWEKYAKFEVSTKRGF